MGKRQGQTTTNGAAKRQKSSILVQNQRVRELRVGSQGSGPVIYWMSRDQRTIDNWALLYAAQKAQEKGVPYCIFYSLVPGFLEEGARQYGFMLRGLKVVHEACSKANIPFFLFQGTPQETLPPFVADVDAGLVVVDFSPMRMERQWRSAVSEGVKCPVHEVDAHNVVPAWVASDKEEFAARTIRPKIHKHMPTFMVPFPDLPPQPTAWEAGRKVEDIDWARLIEELTSGKGDHVKEITWAAPGQDAALDMLLTSFIPKRLAKYHEKRNIPGVDGLSNLSPYFHFGQLSPQRAALEVAAVKSKYREGVDTFIEESVVRRELSDNYVLYNPFYDSLEGAKDWAKKTLAEHEKDKREYIYSREQLEAGKTHDDLWNAAQLEMVHYGKMHGYIRMYWAKKILEWSPTPSEAVLRAIYLNDKYSIDGRDPNGFVGCMWSICGVHDRGWTERSVFGKIRFMNYNGCKRKFDVNAYIRHVDNIVSAAKKQKPGQSKSKKG